MMTSNVSSILRSRSALTSSWLLRFNPQRQPALRLFCFPYAGGDANIFRSWTRDLPPVVEVIGAQYPGRGAHHGVPIDRCETLVSELSQQLIPFLDRDYAFFGHSNGALVAFELARTLQRMGVQPPRLCFFSARGAAHLPTGRRVLSTLDAPEFVAALREMGGMPQAILDDGPMLNLLLPRLRADFALGETYRFSPGPLLHCDICLFHGERDYFVDWSKVQRWTEIVEGETFVKRFPGDHFFLRSCREELLHVVGERLSRVLRQASEQIP